MLPKHKAIIRDNVQELADVTKDVDVMIDNFFERKILNQWHVEFLRGCAQERKRNLEFYDMMTCRGPDAFNELLAALRATGNFRAEKIMASSRVLVYDPEVIVKPSVDELDLAPSEEELIMDTVVRVKKHPDSEFMDLKDESELGILPYRMRSRPRGYALLINIYKTVGKDDRVGSCLDMLKLESLFSELGFEVIKKVDLTDQQIKDEVTMLKRKPELMNVDCLIVFVMCHGSQKRSNDASIDLCASNGKPVNSYWIAEQFQKNVHLPEGKPRLFFFQACRVASDKDMSRNNRDVETDSELISKGRSTEDDGQPPFQDTFIGYSTVPGNYSMRDPKKGSWFVEIFCEVIADKAWKYDLEDMWRLIDEKMRTKTCAKYGYQTTEQVKRAFKRLYFNPHLYGD